MPGMVVQPVEGCGLPRVRLGPRRGRAPPQHGDRCGRAGPCRVQTVAVTRCWHGSAVLGTTTRSLFLQRPSAETTDRSSYLPRVTELVAPGPLSEVSLPSVTDLCPPAREEGLESQGGRGRPQGHGGD